MAHKTLIGGTAYKVSGGKTLIGGTAYKIKNGKTLINGTAYKVPLKKETYYVNLTGSMDTTCGYATIPAGGTRYESNTENIPIEEGTQISLKVSASHSDQQYRCSISLNGNVVQDGAGTYTFTPTGNCTIDFKKFLTIVNWTAVNYWKAEITM